MKKAQEVNQQLNAADEQSSLPEEGKSYASSITRCESPCTVLPVNRNELITELDLSRQQLVSLSPTLYQNCPHLIKLTLEYNWLTEVQSEICLLPRLKELRLDNNKLTRLPSAICDLPTLELMSVGCNELIELPHAMGRLAHSLRYLNIAHNFVEELPYVICELAKLEVLHVEDNWFSTLPTSFYRLRKLIELGLEWLSYADSSYPTVVHKPETLTRIRTHPILGYTSR